MFVWCVTEEKESRMALEWLSFFMRANFYRGMKADASEV
jgi:hypothetical protein